LVTRGAEDVVAVVEGVVAEPAVAVAVVVAVVVAVELLELQAAAPATAMTVARTAAGVVRVRRRPINSSWVGRFVERTPTIDLHPCG
jgi:hypothetical protein